MIELPGLVKTDTGWRLAETGEYIIEVWPMMFNWRLVVGEPETWGRTVNHGYCYFGRDGAAFTRAVLAGHAWSDPLHTPPAGFDKQAF